MIKHIGDKWVLFTKDGSRRLGTHNSEADAQAQERAVEASKARNLHVLGATGQIRTATHEGREHLVVPVIALMQGVIHAINAETPELVPLEALTCAPQGWNGRPVVLGHPAVNGRQISANSPKVLEDQAFGTIFGAHVNGKKLVMEAWIDVGKAMRIGADKMLADLRANKQTEVSVGAFVVTENTAGTYGNKPYKAIWKDIVPDHVAFLPKGVGACSLEMGCGSNRAATAHLVTAEGFETLIGNGNNQYTQGGGSPLPDKAQIGLATHESIIAAKPVDNAPHGTFHAIHVESKWVLGKGSKRSPQLLQKKAALTKKGWVVEHGTKGDSKITQFKSPHGHTAEQAMHEFKTAEEGQPMTLRERVRTFITELRAASAEEVVAPIKEKVKAEERTADAYTDTPDEAASEEAAELIGYRTLRTLCDQLGESYDSASNIVDELIADEEEDPTETPGQEDAETEVEEARLESLQVLAMSMYSTLNAIMGLTNDLLTPDDMAGEATNVVPRYMMGARHSASDMKILQGVHDNVVALGASCKSEYKAAAEHEGGVPAEEELMTKELKAAAVKALVECPSSGFTVADVKMLELAGDDRIEAFTAEMTKRVKADTDLKAAQDKIDAELKAAQEKATKAEADLKVAQAAQIPAEELTELRSLAAAKKASDATIKADLVGKLKTAAKDVFSEEELNAKSIVELTKLATLTGVNVEEKPSFEGRAVPRTAGGADDVYANPPDPYAPGLAAMRAAAAGTNAVN